MEAIVAKNEEVGRVVEIIPYASLDPETRQLVDNDVIKLSQMQDTDIMSYGWDVQAKKNQILNNFVSSFESLSVRDIDVILSDIMKSRKSVTPRKQTFFSKEYAPTIEDKQKFVGKVGELEKAIKAQIARLLENNNTYARLILECKNVVDSYAVCVMAIDKYLAETDDVLLREVLERKKESLIGSRVVNLQSAAMYMNLYRNNGLLMNRLYEIINVNLHQMQEQILIQTGIEEIKKVLSQCEGIKDSIYSLTAANLEELNSGSIMDKLENSTVKEEEDVEKLTEEMIEGLKVFANHKPELLQKRYATSLTLTHSKPTSMKDEILVRASELSMDDEFMQYVPIIKNEIDFKEELSRVIQKGVKDFYKTKGDLSFTEDRNGICYTPGKFPASDKSYNWCKKAAEDYKPEFNSRLGTRDEYIAFLGVIMKALLSEGWGLRKVWYAVCVDSKELGNYRDHHDDQARIETTGSRPIFDYLYDLANMRKILAWDEDCNGFWWAGGDYTCRSMLDPIASLSIINIRNTVLSCATPWVVMPVA